jgi:protein SCO1/2
MLYRGAEIPRPFLTSAFTLLTCSILLAPLPVRAEEEVHADEHAHHHHHHMVPAGSQRTEATYAVPAVDLVDQHGRKQSIAQLMATQKPVLLDFIYTTCTAICPVMSATFQQVQRELGEDADKVLMVSVSIDPEQDTPSALADYAQRFDAGPQWVFLTGSLEDSITVEKAFDAYRGDKMNHAPVTLLRVGPDSPWIRFDGFASAADLTKEIQATLGG